MKDLVKSILRGPVGCYMIATYLRAVYFTSRKIHHPDQPDKFARGTPATIYANWHGQNFLFPFWFRGKAPTSALVALHGDGQMIGRAIEILGVNLVHGSGGGNGASKSKGGARAFLQLMKVLQNNRSVTMTADAPKLGRQVGEGIILLARKSGAPIVPIAMATSKRIILKNWDKTQIHLPFSRVVYVTGKAMFVPDDDTSLAVHQQTLQRNLDAAQDLAFRLADKT